MALKTSLDNPRRKASFFRGQFKALGDLPCHWGHLEVSLKPFPAVFLLSLIVQQCSPGHATVMFPSLVVNALIFWVLYLIFISPQSLFLFIALWNIYFYSKIHLVLSACPIFHLSAHTFFNSAAHSLIIHQSIYTFFYPSSRSPSLFFSLCCCVTSLIFAELSCLSPVGPAGLAVPEYQTVSHCIPSCTQNCHETLHS